MRPQRSPHTTNKKEEEEEKKTNKRRNKEKGKVNLSVCSGSFACFRGFLVLFNTPPPVYYRRWSFTRFFQKKINLSLFFRASASITTK